MLKAVRQETTVKPGGLIELAPTDLPVGALVEVIVVLTEEAERPSTETSDDDQWGDFYKNIVGVWKDDDEISQIFEEIEKERHLDRSGETPVFENGAS